MNPKDQFLNNKKQFASEAEKLSSRYNRISAARITLFVLVLIIIVYFANTADGSNLMLTVVIFVVAFVAMILRHNRIRYARNRARFLEQINQEELDRMDGKLSGFSEGKRFQSVDHEYSSDLDIFGRNSIFQLINRSTTVVGVNTLASWLLSVPPVKEILARQVAVKELAEELSWRQEWQAAGLHFHEDKPHIKELICWLKSDDQLVPKWVAILRYILPIITLIVTIGTIFFSVQLGWVLILLIINGVVLSKVFKKASEVNSQTNRGLNTLKAFEALIGITENSKFHSPLLTSLKGKFQNSGSASGQIRKLKRILHLLNSRSNMFYAILNFFFLLDVHTLVKALRWKKNNANSVQEWFDALGQIEALNSIAGIAYANPDYCFPIISENECLLNTTNLGHPLIHSSERVANDFSIKNKGEIRVITGSNMSGKSTFLRTIGVNIVLSMMGAPVCATHMELSRLQLFTSMRTQDNLEEHISSFYAELKRIRQLLDLIQTNEIPIFYMLDEILKGTNSVDRHTGSVALLNQLHKYNGFGLISTHDLDLGKIADKLSFTGNSSFNSSISDNEILFDYKLSQGICNSFNASKLMKKMGIEIDS